MPQNHRGDIFTEVRMAGARESIHGQWSSRWMFILAATGSAVGLGNIGRFFGWLDAVAGFIILSFYSVVAVFVGWRMSKRSAVEELGVGDGVFSRTWRMLVQVIAPVGVLLIFGNALVVFLYDVGVLD